MMVVKRSGGGPTLVIVLDPERVADLGAALVARRRCPAVKVKPHVTASRLEGTRHVGGQPGEKVAGGRRVPVARVPPDRARTAAAAAETTIELDIVDLPGCERRGVAGVVPPRADEGPVAGLDTPVGVWG
eukprot:SAG22_NODE_2355_length_2672_cov_1.682472_2_plen_130_part_00